MRRAFIVLGCALAWSYSGAHFPKTGVFLAWGNFLGDFLSNFPSGRIAAWFNRPDFFEGTLAEYWNPVPSWGFGPVLHLVTLPLFAFPSLPVAYKAWLFVNYGFLVLNYFPLYESLIPRHMEIFELLLILVAMTLYAKRRDTAAGAWIGFAAMTKFLPGILVPYFALKRRWRACGAALLVIGGGGILAQAKGTYPAKLYHYCLMSNHLHLLVQLESGTHLPKCMQRHLQDYGRWYKVQQRYLSSWELGT